MQVNTKIHLDLKDKLLSGISWSTIEKDKVTDIDLIAIMLDKDGNFINKNDLIFYNNLFSQSGALFHTGDNKTGNSMLDDEAILINLEKIPQRISTIRFGIFNSSNTENIKSLKCRISVLNDIFDTKGNDIFTYNFDYPKFDVIYIFELQKLEDGFAIEVKLENLDTSIDDIFDKYNIIAEK